MSRGDGRLAAFTHRGHSRLRRLPGVAAQYCAPPHGRELHLHHAGPPEGPRWQGHPEGHLPVLLPGGEDRGHRAERGRQVHPASDHGRSGQRVLRDRAPGPEHPGGLPSPGAAAGRVPGREGQRGAGGEAPPRRAGPVQRGLEPARRADGRHTDGEAPRRAGQTSRFHRRAQRLGAGPDARGGDGRTASAAARGSRDAAVGW